MEVRGGYTLSHGVDEAGAVNRLFFDMEAEVWGEKGRTNLPPPDDAGTRVLAGRIRAEHVFTRPFAGPGERRVVAIPTPEGPFIPKAQRIHRAPTEPLTLPAGAKALGDALRDDGTSLRFGASHTDSNQHVNSLVYPRLFEDAALRRFAALGKSTQVRAREAVLAYRKPSFAGDGLRVLLQAFTAEDGSLGCIGAFVAEDDPSPERARVYVRMLFAAAG
jgi:hypothetical protein